MPYADNNGIRIHYEVVGSGVPLVLHPGFIGCLEDWDDGGYVRALRHRYRLILLDPRGQGQSDKPHDPADYTAQQRAADVLAILDAEGVERAHIWGYSLGGWVGLALGVSAPRRLRSLVLGSVSPFVEHRRPIEGDPFLEEVRGGMATLVQAWGADPEFWLSPGERERWLVADPEALSAARQQRLTEPSHTEDDIATIPCPVLMYVGTADESVPVVAVERTVRLMPDASIVTLPGLDHAQTFARNDLVLPPVLAFLTGVDSIALARP